MTMAEIQASYGQNGKSFDLTTKLNQRITILTIDRGAYSRISVAMVKFFDHCLTMSYPPPGSPSPMKVLVTYWLLLYLFRIKSILQ